MREAGISEAVEISVVIPVYNAAAYLAAAVASVRAQKAERLEIILVNDGSVDESRAVIATLGPDVIVIDQPNAGPSAARNRGVERARGSIIAFLDADDIWPDGRLALMRDAFEREPALDVVMGRTEMFGEGATQLDGLEFEDDRNGRKVQIAPVVGCALFRRRVLERVGPFDETLRRYEDHDWFIRAREAGAAIRILAEVTLRYRVHQASLTRSGPRQNTMTQVLKRALERRRAAGDVHRDVGRLTDGDVKRTGGSRSG